MICPTERWTDRLFNSRVTLQLVLVLESEFARNLPLVVLFNKSDKIRGHRIALDDLKRNLGLSGSLHRCYSNHEKLGILASFSCSAYTGEGYLTAFEWLGAILVER